MDPNPILPRSVTIPLPRVIARLTHLSSREQRSEGDAREEREHGRRIDQPPDENDDRGHVRKGLVQKADEHGNRASDSKRRADLVAHPHSAPVVSVGDLHARRKKWRCAL